MGKVMIAIKDNYLPLDEIDKIETAMKSYFFAWYLPLGGIVHNNEVNDLGGYFTHIFYDNSEVVPSTQYGGIRNLIYDNIKPTAIIRVKGNLFNKTEKIIEHGFHIDYDFKHENCWTSIFYINTNNGYTKFEDGTKVDSIKNRLLTFPTHMRHTSSTCTDENYRINININYYR